MNNRSYYALPVEHPFGLLTGSRHSDEAPLIVNCAGCFETAFPFQSDNPEGRADYYCMYVRRGTLTLHRPQGYTDIGSGSLVILPPHTHYHYAYTGKGEPLSYFWVHFTGSHAHRFLEQLGLSPLPLVHSHIASPRVVDAFETLLDCFANGEPLRDAWLSCRLEQLLLRLAAATLASDTPLPLARSLHYIDRHYTEEISVNELAAMDALSYSRYHDVFVAHIGLSPKRYIIRKRLSHACELLLTTDMSVTQIGVQVGYPDACFFSKIFKQEMGCSPSVYRQNNT